MENREEKTLGFYEINALEDFDRYCIQNATHFRCVRGLNPLTRTRENFPSLEQAKQYAATFGDRRTIIYAVTSNGRAAAIANL